MQHRIPIPAITDDVRRRIDRANEAGRDAEAARRQREAIEKGQR